MESKKKDFDAVAMVRSIRDTHYEETKDMSPDEMLKWYTEKGREAHEYFERLAKEVAAKKTDA
jgi:hypothetical protein